MVQYNITGMSCAACSARVEKAVGAVEGVTSCSVSLLTNSMGVEGTAAPADIVKAVEKAGYGAALKGNTESSAGNAKSANNKSADDELTDKETPKLKARFFVSLGFLAILMYISMGAMMWGAPLPPFLANDHVAMGLAQLLLTVVIMVINQRFFISGFRGLIHRAPNMDTLVALGSAAAFGYSVYALFVMSNAQAAGDHELATSYMHELWFESAGTILTLITLGKLLEARSKGRTTNALKSLIKLAPQTAVILKNGEEVTVPVEEVKIGDIFAVRAGDSIPTDGVIVEGEAAINESALTGESIPADKIAGDEVFAATISQSGYIRCRATRVGEDTSLAQIIKTVSDAAATKAPIAKIADKVSGVFVPAVMIISLVTMLVWPVMGEGISFALERGISVLVISCPCALGLATPVAIMVGSGMGAKNGILFKTAVTLENTGKTDVVLLDKTGTITSGEPAVTDVIPSGISEAELLKAALSVEARSEHPLARAVVKHAAAQELSPQEPESFEVLRGSGIAATLGGRRYIAGNLRLAETYCDIGEDMKAAADRLAQEGKTPLFFCRDGALIGIIACADKIKEDSPAAVSRLKKMGIRTVMLTGDNKVTAQAVGKQAGVDEVIAGVLPGGKEDVVKALQAEGARVIMVGDGVNDAPALTRADIGVAIGAGSDIALDAADIVLMKSRLSDVPAAIKLSRRTLLNIKENLFWAFIYNVIGIPLAAGVWIAAFGWRLNPMFGAAAMSLSSFCVVTNALRLNFLDIYNGKSDRPLSKTRRNKAKQAKSETQEEKTMEITMKIEGMMCGHCEAAVKKALEAVPGVAEAVVSHTEGTAVVKLSEPAEFETLKKAVEDKDYKVVG